MEARSALRVFPFSVGGAAVGTPLPAGPVTLRDLTPEPRFGIKGAGSAEWLAKHGVMLPAVNRIASHDGVRVLRLGKQDFVCLAEWADEDLRRLARSWSGDTGPKGYSSWREEGWAWMRLSGERVDEAMAALCALDLRPGRFGRDELAQTRVASIEAVVFRSDQGFDVLFDISASAFFARAVAAVAEQLSTRPFEEEE